MSSKMIRYICSAFLFISLATFIGFSVLYTIEAKNLTKLAEEKIEEQESLAQFLLQSENSISSNSVSGNSISENDVPSDYETEGAEEADEIENAEDGVAEDGASEEKSVIWQGWMIKSGD